MQNEGLAEAGRSKVCVKDYLLRPYVGDVSAIGDIRF